MEQHWQKIDEAESKNSPIDIDNHIDTNLNHADRQTDTNDYDEINEFKPADVFATGLFEIKQGKETFSE